MDVFALVIKATAFVLIAIAALEDVRAMRIRNDLCIGVAVLFIPYAYTLGVHGALAHLACAALVFGVTAGLFFWGKFGGGDAKMLAAIALWLDFSTLPLLLIVMAIAGGALAASALFLMRSGVAARIVTRFPVLASPEHGWLPSLARGQAVVPYGVALSVAAAVTFF